LESLENNNKIRSNGEFPSLSRIEHKKVRVAFWDYYARPPHPWLRKKDKELLKKKRKRRRRE
jgi:hypothetical protein